ncbi:unnamed protein product [Scytosiphon promiscuus]
MARWALARPPGAARAEAPEKKCAVRSLRPWQSRPPALTTLRGGSRSEESPPVSAIFARRESGHGTKTAACSCFFMSQRPRSLSRHFQCSLMPFSIRIQVPRRRKS